MRLRRVVAPEPAPPVAEWRRLPTVTRSSNSSQPSQTLPSKEITLKRSQMETAIYIDHLARRIREIAARDGRHRATHILRLSPASDGPDALLDHLVVFLLHAFAHVGSDDAWSQLVNVDAVFGQPRGVKSSHHRQPRLGYAVVASIDRCGVCRD